MQVENRYRILKAVNLVFVGRSGEFVLGNFAGFMARLLDGPDFVPGMNFLIDQRRVTFPNVRYADVATMMPIWERLHERMGPCRMGFVHTEDGPFATGRMSASVLSTGPVERAPFREIGPALKWLGVPAETELPELF
jgi:hypothetical protein